MIRNTIIAILTCAYCIATLLNTISFAYPFQWSYSRSNSERMTIELVSGGFYLAHIKADTPSNLELQSKIESLLPNRYGFRASPAPPAASLRLGFPGIFLIILLGLYPGVAFLRGPARRWHRRRRGLCINCGYNLVGNTSGVCPECGLSR